jgi:hypothetical protein
MDSVASLCGCHKVGRSEAAFLIVSHFRGHVLAHTSPLKVIGGLDMGYMGAALRGFECLHHLDHQKNQLTLMQLPYTGKRLITSIFTWKRARNAVLQLNGCSFLSLDCSHGCKAFDLEFLLAIDA